MNSSSDSRISATKSASDEQLENAARAMASLDREQLQKLVDRFYKGPGNNSAHDVAFAAPRCAGPCAPANPGETGSNNVLGVDRPLFQRLQKRLWELFLALSPAILALVLAPYVIRSTFEQERRVAGPVLSIEYAFLTEQDRLPSDKIKQAVSSIGETDVYNEYLWKTFGQHDFRLFVTSADQLGPAMRQRLSDAANVYRDYLNARHQELSRNVRSLSTLPLDELRKMAHTHLDSMVGLDEDQLREQLSIRFNDTLAQVAQAVIRVDELSTVLTASTRLIRMKLTILNKGATDGLVRHHGTIEYRGRTYDMYRVAPPSNDLNTLAVPTFQTNMPDTDISAHSVGKVGRDSMTEFWYAFVPDNSSASEPALLCDVGETVAITLRDHEDAKVPKTLPCEGEA